MGRRWTILLGTLLLMPGTLRAAEAGPWPQFRGPEGLGVSSATGLPAHWDTASPNLRWRTELPGYGVSSPIVSGGRIFVTTAFESRRAARLKAGLRLAGTALVALALLGWVLRWVGARRALRAGQPSAWPRSRTDWADEALLLFVVLSFLALAYGVTVQPDSLERWLDHVGRLLAKKHPDLEKLVTIDPGVYAGVWLTAGAIGLWGLAAVVACLRGLIWRLFVTGALTWAAWTLFRHTPPDEWYETIKTGERLIFLVPGISAGWLALLDSFEAHRVPVPLTDERTAPQSPRGLALRLRNRHPWRPGDLGSSLCALCLLALVAMVFVPGNFLLAGLGVDRAVLCLDQDSGAILWETVVWTAPGERKHSDNSYATPTCATDGEHVLAFFGGVLTGLDRDGRIRWQFRDEDYLKNCKYGSSSSPIIADGLGVVLQGKEDKSRRSAWLAAFDLESGDLRWRIEPGDLGEGYTTPLVRRVADVTLLLVPTEHRLNAYELSSGRRLWSLATPLDQVVASLTATGDTLVLGGGTWGPRALVAYRLAPNPERPPRVLWQGSHGAPGCSSPVIVGGRLYVITDRGLFSVYDLETGRVLWSRSLGGRYLASLIGAEGKLYALNTKGRMTVIDLSREETILARNTLPGKCQATGALAPGCLILRVGTAMLRIDGPEPGTAPTPPGSGS